jgi:hypothetical protein
MDFPFCQHIRDHALQHRCQNGLLLIHRTSNHADASGGSADAARLDGSAAADRGTNNKSHQATTMLHNSKPPAEDELLLVMMARQRAASGRGSWTAGMRAGRAPRAGVS